MIPPGTVGVNNKSAIFVVQMDSSVSVCPEPPVLPHVPVMTGSGSGLLAGQKGGSGQGLGLAQGSGLGSGQELGSGLELVHSEAHIVHFITEVGVTNTHPPPFISSSSHHLIAASPHQHPLFDTPHNTHYRHTL